MRSILILGPHQVGKSTLIASLKPDLTVNLASPAAFRDYASYSERLEHDLRGAERHVRTVFIDEVQRVSALLDLVQVFLDEHPRRFRFLLFGSSSRKLKMGQANLLPGRVHVYYLHSLLASNWATNSTSIVFLPKVHYRASTPNRTHPLVKKTFAATRIHTCGRKYNRKLWFAISADTGVC